MEAYKKLIQRRIRREPVAYITGKKEFWSMDLTVTPEVLVPRPETECLVEAVLDLLPGDGIGSRKCILELGTGSGAVILALASERPRHRFFALDKSVAALRIARKNARHHGLEQSVHFFASDWFDALDATRIQFDIIVSNPPYVQSSEIPLLEPEISRFEPRSALNGGPDGLKCIRKIIDEAPRYLKAYGWLVLEMGHDQRDGLRKLVDTSGAFSALSFRRDYGGNDRVAGMKVC